MTNLTNLKFRPRLKARLRLCSLSMSKQFGDSSAAIRAIATAALSTAFTNLIFLPLLSVAFFVVYMGHHKFFSYDFFSEGIFGMKLFVLAMVVGLIVTSFSLFGFGILFYARRKGADISKYWVVVAGVLNALFLMLAILSLLDEEKRVYTIFVLIVTLYLAIHFSLFFFAKFKIKIALLIGLFFVSFGAVATRPELSAKLLGVGLKTFGVGGEVPIEIVSDDGVVKAELILLTPKNVYYKEGGKNVLAFQALDKIKKIRYVNP